MIVFFSILTVAAINAQIVHYRNGNIVKRRRLFQETCFRIGIRSIEQTKPQSLKGMLTFLQLALISLGSEIQMDQARIEQNPNDNTPRKRTDCTPCVTEEKKDSRNTFVKLVMKAYVFNTVFLCAKDVLKTEKTPRTIVTTTTTGYQRFYPTFT